MAKITSVNEVLIRLTDERWQHITTAHPEMAEHYHEILETIEFPEVVYPGKRAAHIALQKIDSDHHLVVIYKENTEKDGFVITAFKTSKPDTFKRGEPLWQRST